MPHTFPAQIDRFKQTMILYRSPWGRHLCYQKALALVGGAFFVGDNRRVVFYGGLVRIDCYTFHVLAEEKPFLLG